MGDFFVILLGTVITIRIRYMENNRAQDFEGPLRSIGRMFLYFTQETADISYGKEKRIYGFSANLSAMYRKLLHRFERTLGESNKAKRGYILASEAIGALIYLPVFYFLYQSRATDAGSIVAFLSLLIPYIDLLYESAKDISLVYTESFKVRRMFAFLASDSADIDGEMEEVETVRFDNVSFRYHENAPFALQNISMTLQRGERVALLGLNGAGKTTLTKLMLEILTPTTGDIFINGKNMKDIAKDALYRRVTYMEQDPPLFSLTVREFLDAPCDEALFEVLRTVRLYKKKCALPDGLETELTNFLNPEGLSLSQGEIRKLYISRALLRTESDMYIFDEPTASLDQISEEHLYGVFQERFRDNLAIFISHRLLITQFCDRVIVLDKGRIVEDGTWEELLKKPSYFRKMFDAERENEGKNEK